MKNVNERKYYEAYDERYKTVHRKGLCWSTDTPSPIVFEIIEKYNITAKMKLLELGCGEGRDAYYLLKNGFHLLATDISPEAINFCQKRYPTYKDNFQIVDCIKDSLNEKYDFIFAVAVIHMLVLDDDRNAFYRFLHTHLTEGGVALICSMGDGNTERQSDIRTAFELQERNCEGEKVFVAGTSCRMINNEIFSHELERNHLFILEKGQTSIPNAFPDMMYAVVKK
ncbi:MAG: class I SAM-dependent methyltransferase [Clostridia bacterium]|nr:class I SAM-dependent methyltransferase [Clostridia bacterium]